MAANGKDQKHKIGWIGAGRMGPPIRMETVEGFVTRRNRHSSIPMNRR